MSANVVGALIALMILFGAVVTVIAFFCFESAFKQEYSTTTYHMARSASLNVNGDHIDNYLNGEWAEEYEDTRERLDKNCKALNVSLLYVIKVDTSDYNSFLSVFNVVYNDVDNTKYTPWALGYKQNTTNEEYRQKYIQIYENGSSYETVFRFHTSNGSHPHITTLVPVKNSANNVTSLLCIQRPIREMEEAFAPYFLFITLGVVLMAAVIITISTLFIRKAIINPVTKVSKETMRFAKESTSAAPLGEISKYEDILNLARSIDSMEKEMVSYIENITKITAEKEKIGAELSIAAQIQKQSLPDVFPAFPDRSEFDIYALMEPAKEVGGDFYNFFLVDDDHLALAIADVSDKGVPAALFMMVTNILISERAKMYNDPAEVLNYVSKDLYEHNRSGMFVTIWLGILELSTGKLVSSNAGHEDPILYRNNGSWMVVKEKHGFIAGAMDVANYQNQTIFLHKGDKIFVYTDGLSEAKNATREMFSTTRILKSLSQHKQDTPKDILAGVRKDVDEFVGEAPQFDDLTMLCLEYK